MSKIRPFLPYVITLAFLAWCVYSLNGDFARLTLAPVLQAWDLVVLACALSLANYVLRIIRWRMYLKRLGVQVPLRFAALTFAAGFAYTVSPGKVGEMVRARYFVPLGVPVGNIAAAFFAERLLDLLAMAVLAAMLFTATAHNQLMIVVGTGGAIAVLLVLTLIPWPAVSAWITTAAHIPGRIRSLLVKVTTALDSTRKLLTPKLLLAGFLLGFCAWILEGLGLGVLGSMFPPVHLATMSAIGIYGVAVLVGGISFLPGGVGSTEAVMTALLATHGYSVGEAFLITLTCRLVTLWLAVGLGWAAVFVLRQRTVREVTPWQ
jgi:glycosyltransferase 2 family protein